MSGQCGRARHADRASGDAVANCGQAGANYSARWVPESVSWNPRVQKYVSPHVGNREYIGRVLVFPCIAARVSAAASTTPAAEYGLDPRAGAAGEDERGHRKQPR